MKYLIILALTLITTSAFAKRQILSIIHNDIDKDTNHLSIDVDDMTQEITMIILQGHDAKGNQISNREFTYEDVTINGVVLIENEGKEVIVLKPANNQFDFLNAGEMKLIYLYSGITNSKKELQINLAAADEAGDFYLTTVDGKKTNRMSVKSNKLFGKVIGIKEIQLLQE